MLITRGSATTGPRDRVAFQGRPGAFSEEAVLAWFTGGCEPVPEPDFPAVALAVEAGNVDWGVLPVENTIAGCVTGTVDVLATVPLSVVGEVMVPIRHCVLGLPGTRLEDLTRVSSHPVALAQCTAFLRSRPRLEAVAVQDTAGAAEAVAAAGEPTHGAIASRGAGERYGLDVLVEDVQDRPDNQTRFLVVRAARPAHDAHSTTDGNEAPAADPPQPGPVKLVLLVETPNAPGALLNVLRPLAEQGFNLSNLVARPVGEPWTYRFFLEFEAPARDAALEAALAEVGRGARTMRVLGSFSAVPGGGAL
ncbi:MAG: prephenate dehydratase domain-containing protein [Gemmatimonadota bacterium]